MTATTPEKPIATVVIPARNAAHLIVVQLEALAAQTCVGQFEVVVSDNGSTDATPDVVRAFVTDLPGLRMVDSSDKPGVSHARNVGARSARAPVVLFCDADDEADPGWVQAMVEALGGADLVGGPLMTEKLTDPRALGWRSPPPTDALPVTMRFLPYATGANLGVRTSLFSALDGFDTSFVGGHEEVDFAWRAQLSGHTVAFAPNAVMHYRLRGDVRGTVKQTFGYGRSYAQLFSRFPTEPIPRTPWKREVRTYLILARQGAQAIRSGDTGKWMSTAGWTAGRLYGDLRYRVRVPL